MTINQTGQHIEKNQINIAGDGSIGQVGDNIHIAQAQLNLPSQVIDQFLAFSGQDQQENFALEELPKEEWEPETILITAGAFQMGSPPNEGISPFETPQFDILLPAYRIGKYPVKNREYAHFIRKTSRPVPSELGWRNGNQPSEEQYDQPVKGVVWYDALAYCSWLISETKRPYTLPSEAQWEKAAHNNLEMTDSVREWTTSLWGRKRRHNPDAISRYPWESGWKLHSGHDALKENRQIRRVTRGASLLPDAPFRATRRESELPYRYGLKNGRIGFRVVLNWEETA